LNPSVIIPSEERKQDWVERNIQKMVTMLMKDARVQRPLPLGITMSSIALTKFVAYLKSKSLFHPEIDGRFKFLGIPVHENKHLPSGTFVLEKFKPLRMMEG